MSGATLAPGVKARDTADWDTPAARATSWAVMKERSLMVTALLRKSCTNEQPPILFIEYDCKYISTVTYDSAFFPRRTLQES
ncbi:hypothetical protein SBA_ch2_1620 [Sphingomonas bisphenolicum]|uniref:Uncharacterized protein n=1 Tax=Sphingomonas bisphenolicum TaxID=296544 RepID=A0ABM7G887_9SPHN|nr:hypothetical protein SBA_ch2_1620 [Sphingomonas bisphenolicum]